MVVALIGLCACQKDSDTQPSGEQPASGEDVYQPRKDVPNYGRIYSHVTRIHFNEYNNVLSKIEFATTREELAKFNILGNILGMDEDEEVILKGNVAMLISFHYSSSDRIIEFVDVAVKDGKFYPIFATDSPIANEPSTDDERIDLYVVVVSEEVLDYDFQEILAINRRDLNFGSSKYKSITKVFD